MAKDDEDLHKGHRERLLNTISSVGLSEVNLIQAVEFILFYIFPRGDVNPLAHRLINKFKSVHVILDASVEDLASVKGMGVTSAKKLKALVDVFNIYTLSKVNKENGISTFGDVYDFAEQLLRYKMEEELYVIGFNNMGKYVSHRCLARGTLSMVGIEMREISNFINTYRVPNVYIVHNHPGGSCKSSQQDESSNDELTRKFEFSGCALLDNFIVGIDGIYSMKDHTMKRVFRENDKYDDILSLIDGTYKDGQQNFDEEN